MRAKKELAKEKESYEALKACSERYKDISGIGAYIL